jgi:HlyD family secretion protein
MKKRIVIRALVVSSVAAGAAVLYLDRRPGTNELVVQGNVDLRQVDLPFKDNERIVEVLAQEGDRVRAGQVLARLDVERLRARIAEARAQVSAQQEVLRRLKNGSRPEEIAQARANVDSASADAENAERQYNRLLSISRVAGSRAVSESDVDEAFASLRVMRARLVNARKGLQLSIAGPREEDIAEAQAQFDAANAQLELLLRQLADAQLVSPTDAVVRSRLMEPGEMASPQRPVFSLAVTDPKWIRAYVSESDLGRLKPGMSAEVTTDTEPDRPLPGWVGYISSVAEFTPKTVQTEELRTRLVYEVRVFVKDPRDELRLGMPATVHLNLESVQRLGHADASKNSPRNAAPSPREPPAVLNIPLPHANLAGKQ